MFFLIFAKSSLCHKRQAMESLVNHVPHTHRQVIPVSPVQRHAFKAIAVMRTGLLAGAMITGRPDLL